MHGIVINLLPYLELGNYPNEGAQLNRAGDCGAGCADGESKNLSKDGAADREPTKQYLIVGCRVFPRFVFPGEIDTRPPVAATLSSYANAKNPSPPRFTRLLDINSEDKQRADTADV